MKRMLFFVLLFVGFSTKAQIFLDRDGMTYYDTHDFEGNLRKNENFLCGSQVLDFVHYLIRERDPNKVKLSDLSKEDDAYEMFIIDSDIVENMLTCKVRPNKDFRGKKQSDRMFYQKEAIFDIDFNLTEEYLEIKFYKYNYDEVDRGREYEPSLIKYLYFDEEKTMTTFFSYGKFGNIIKNDIRYHLKDRGVNICQY